MITVHNLSKSYGHKLAVDNISFEAQEGEILGILGPNGAGKTTTMRILTGFMPPTSGSASIAGFDVLQDSFEVRKRVGYMPEHVPIYPDMTVQEYVTFWAKLRGVRHARRNVNMVLERVQLITRRHSLVRSLSKGLTQRLGLAQALVHDPPVIILDEPTIGIDPRQVIEVRQMVRDLRQTHTVLFSTHILSEAEQVCDRVLILNNGQVVAQGQPDELRRQLHGGDNLYVEVGDLPQSTVPELLRSVQGVESVTPQGAGYVVRTQGAIDHRANVSRGIVQAGGTVLELRPVAMTLEDIFLDVVGRDG